MAEVWEVHPVTGATLGDADRHRIWLALIRRDAARFARRIAPPQRSDRCAPRQGSKACARRAKMVARSSEITTRSPTEKD